MKNSPSVAWKIISLSDLVVHVIGGMWGDDPKTSLTKESIKVKVIRGSEFKNWKTDRAINATERIIPLSGLENRRLKEGDIIIEISGGGPEQPVGRTIYIDHATLNSTTLPLICNNFLRLIRLSVQVDPQFVQYYLDYQYNLGKFNPYQTNTTNLRNLNFDEFSKNIGIPLIPLEEQKKLVAKLKLLLSLLEKVENKLVEIEGILSTFRHSVLNILTTNSTEEMTPLGELLSDVKYGTSKKSSYDIEGTPVLRIPNIADTGHISSEDLKYTRFEKTEREKLELKEGDLLVIRSNGSRSLVGKSAIVTKSFIGYAYAGYLIRLRVDNERILPEYLNYVLASPIVRKQIEKMARSTNGINNINSYEIKGLNIQLPNLKEQKEKVKQITRLFDLAANIESKFYNAKEKAKALNQAILHKTFQGRFGPYDYNERSIDNLQKEIIEEKLQKTSKIKKHRTNDKAIKKRNPIKRKEILNTNSSGVYDTLKANGGQMFTVDVWQKSAFKNTIENFYSDLKIEIENKKRVRESDDKSFLSIIK